MPTPAVPPGRRARIAPASALALLLALAASALLLPGCDNPSCVFGGDCSQQGDGGASGPSAPPATFPTDGQWIAAGAPTVTAVLPSGVGASSTTPIVLTFSESIAAATLEGGFELVQELPATPGGPATGPPLPLGGVLVAEGRVAILLPPALVPEATYRVRLSAQGTVTDLSGRVLSGPASGVLGTFAVAQTNPPGPRLVASWPRAGVTNASTIGEVVAVFDRPMNPLTVNPTSFQVRVEGDPPDFDPPAQVLSAPGPFGGTTTEPRVYTWRSVDPSGTPRSLGPDQEVELRLSPAGGTAIESAGGQALASVVVAFRTLALELPLGAEILSGAPQVPDDAIGRAQLDGSAPLMVLVTLAQPAEAGDALHLDLFGSDFGTPRRTRSLARVVELAEGQDEVLLEEDDLDLVAEVSPLRPRFSEGEVAFAFRHVRGTVSTPVRLLDTAPGRAGTQHPVLDIDPPQLVGLGFAGGTLDLRSNLPDLVVTGRADEPLRAVRVEALLQGGTQDNGAVPPVIAADGAGSFVSAPILLGLIDPDEGAIPVLVTVFDRALNPSAPVAATYTQVGAVGPGALAPSDPVEVRVFSSATLAPIAGARVFVHEDDLGVVTPFAVSTTDGAGLATVLSAPFGTTILTVEATGHDIFTFQGVEAQRLDVPLTPTNAAPAAVTLVVRSPIQDLPQLTIQASDSRRPPEAGPTAAAQGCFFNPFTSVTECAFLPFAIASRVPGALSLFATNPSAVNGPGFAQVFLKGFELVLPLDPVAGTESQTVAVEVPALLDSIGADPEEAALDVPSHALLGGASVPGLNSANLSGAPRVSVQALAVGIPGPIFVGLGRTFQTAPDAWAVRAAYAGVADGTQDGPDDELGELVQRGVIDGDLFLEAELVDASGNRAGARPRFSTTSLVLDPPGVPTVQGATVEAGAGSLSFTVTFSDGLADADGMPGLHRVLLMDATGRRWEVWTTDPPDAAGGSVTALFPDVTLLGGTGLSPLGLYSARASTVAWPALDPGGAGAGFLWIDTARERQLFSASAPLVFSAP